MSSSVRCRGTWKIHKRPSESDRRLEEMGFFRKHTARDASCLFRAVAEAVYRAQGYFHRVRQECVQFMAKNRQLFEGSLNCTFENYLEEMSNPMEHGGLVEITSMSHLYRRDFIIFEANKGPMTKICNGYGNTIFLFYSPETKHFDVVYTKEYLNASSFCQSLVYEILYDGVYQLKDLPYAVDMMLHYKVPHQIEYFMTNNVERHKKQKAKIYIESASPEKDKANTALALKCKHHTNDIEKASLLKESLSIFVFNRSLIQLDNVCLNCLNINSAKELLDNGITPFPYKVAKALDPDIYRNIEFDVWSEIRRELRFAARFSDGVTLKVGVKCLCRLQAEQASPYHCHIQEMSPGGGPCLVFIEELGEKRVLMLEQLEPLPPDQVKPWAPPYRFMRANSNFPGLSQMLQQLGNITRKQSPGKPRKAKPLEEPPKNPEKLPLAIEEPPKSWNEELTKATDVPLNQAKFDFAAYQHLDMFFPVMPVEIQALPLMVDCRSGAEVPAQNGEQHANANRTNGGADMAGPVTATAPPATTPANNAVTTYTGAMNPPAYNGALTGAGCYMPCGMKQLVWCAPPHPPPPLPPPHVNPHVYKSVQANGSDLPMNDIATLRFFFNLGVECMWATYGTPPLPPPPPPPPLLRHYSTRDLAQDMAAVSIADRDAKGKESRPPPRTAPRALLGPRFKRGGNQDNGQNNHNNHNNQNKQHNNKGPNNRRNSTSTGAPSNGGERLRSPMAPAPAAAPAPATAPATAPAPVPDPSYLAYPPPMYPLYYPVEGDPSMMGMVGGYVGYEEEYPLHFLPPYPPPPPHPHPPQAMPPDHHIYG